MVREEGKNRSVEARSMLALKNTHDFFLKISLVQTDKKKLSLVVQLSGPTSSGTVECKRT